MRADRELAVRLVEQLFEPDRSVELSPFMDLVFVERLAELTLEAVADDGLPAALLRRLVQDCRGMLKSKRAKRIGKRR